MVTLSDDGRDAMGVAMIIVIVAIWLATLRLAAGVVAPGGCHKPPTVTCPAGKSPVVTAADGGWLVRCEVRP